MTLRLVRQGDVLLIKREALTQEELLTAEKQPAVEGKTVLAYGEITGHCHVIESHVAELFTLATGQQVVVVGEDTQLRHGTLAGGAGDHNPIAVELGVWKVAIAQEYSPQEIRRVVD